MNWKATITGTNILANNYLVTVSFTNGVVTVSDNFAPDLTDPLSLPNLVSTRLKFLESATLYAQAFPAQTTIDDKGAVVLPVIQPPDPGQPNPVI